MLQGSKPMVVIQAVKRMKSGGRTNAGFSLLENLIALIVVSVGLLTAAGLQGVAKRATYDALQRTTAALLAHDIFERMRTNSAALDGYLPPADIGGGSLGPTPALDCRIPANQCSPDQVANFDLWEWEQALDGVAEQRAGSDTGGLIDPTACVTGPVGGGQGLYTVAIAWRGITELPNPPPANCGAGSGKYGASNGYRRVMVMNTFITG
jgi:type IV pilus assembly protein PilV